jgi:hypothetical protein
MLEATSVEAQGLEATNAHMCNIPTQKASGGLLPVLHYFWE